MVLEDAFDRCNSAPGQFHLHEADIWLRAPRGGDGGIGTVGLRADLKAMTDEREAHAGSHAAVIVGKEHAYVVRVRHGPRTSCARRASESRWGPCAARASTRRRSGHGAAARAARSTAAASATLRLPGGEPRRRHSYRRPPARRARSDGRAPPRSASVPNPRARGEGSTFTAAAATNEPTRERSRQPNLHARAAIVQGAHLHPPAERLGALAHADEPEPAAVGGVRRHSVAVVLDREPEAVAARETHQHGSRPAVAGGVRYRLSDDASERLVNRFRRVEAGFELKPKLDRVAEGDLLGRLRDRAVERRADRPRERGDRLSRFVERALGGESDLGGRLFGRTPEAVRLRANEGEFLGEAVVKVPRNATPLAVHRRLGQLKLVRVDLAQGTGKDHHLEREQQERPGQQQLGPGRRAHEASYEQGGAEQRYERDRRLDRDVQHGTVVSDCRERHQADECDRRTGSSRDHDHNRKRLRARLPSDRRTGHHATYRRRTGGRQEIVGGPRLALMHGNARRPRNLWASGGKAPSPHARRTASSGQTDALESRPLTGRILSLIGASAAFAALAYASVGHAQVPAPTGCPPPQNRITGTEGNDLRGGTPLNDLMLGGAGDDIFEGQSGDDCLVMGDGNDRGSGGEDDDRVLGDLGIDRLDGNDGDDVVGGGDGDDILDGGSGNDRVNGEAGDDNVFGGDGGDHVAGGAGSDKLSLGDGADTGSGGTGDDKIFGGPEDDRVDGGAGNDRVRGDDGDDTVRGGPGNDRVVGDAGIDRLFGGAGDDVVDARDGEPDRVDCGPGRDFARLDRFDRIVRGCERSRSI